MSLFCFTSISIRNDAKLMSVNNIWCVMVFLLRYTVEVWKKIWQRLGWHISFKYSINKIYFLQTFFFEFYFKQNKTCLYTCLAFCINFSIIFVMILIDVKCIYKYCKSVFFSSFFIQKVNIILQSTEYFKLVDVLKIFLTQTF